MDAEPGRAGFEVYAFTQRLGQNVVVLHPYPETALDLVRRTVIDGGVGASLLAADLPGQGTAMIVAEDFITEEQVGHVTDDLTLRGVGAYGYALVGGAFRRVGQAWPREGRRVVLAHTFVHQSGPDLAATSWVMGAPGDLEDLGRVLDPVVGVELFGDDAGVASLRVDHFEVEAGFVDPAEASRSLLGAIEDAGFHAMGLITNATNHPHP